MPKFRESYWAPIKNAEVLSKDPTKGGVYMAGLMGTIAFCTLEGARRIIPAHDDGRGYPACSIKIDGKYRTKKVHVLVMGAFKGPTPKGYHIDHDDKNKMNPALNNLIWRKDTENSADCRRGSRKGATHLKPEQRLAAEILIDNGWGTKAIALAICSSETTIRRIRREYAVGTVS